MEEKFAMAQRILTVIVVLVLVSGCTSLAPDALAKVSPPTSTSTPEIPLLSVTTAEATFPPVPTTSINNEDDECDNPFYPVSDEATWTYNLTSGGTAVHVMAVDENGAFTINIQGNDSSFTIDGDCTDEGIVIMNAPGAKTTITDADGNAIVSTTDVKGVTIPNDIKINDQWSQTIQVTTGDQKSLIQTDYTAVGFENITVPAGNFYVLKVEQSGFVEIYGQKINMHGYQWFAEGVGTVKSAMDGAPAAELVSFDIPD